MGSFLSTKLYKISSDEIAHWCPGCNERHVIRIRESEDTKTFARVFDKDYVKPTFSPSIRIQSSAPRTIGELIKPVLYIKCHYFIRRGMIDFCSDSLHPLAGHLVPLPDFPHPCNI